MCVPSRTDLIEYVNISGLHSLQIFLYVLLDMQCIFSVIIIVIIRIHCYFNQSVPVDCEVFQGRSTITIEHLTGEVKPLPKNVGDNIPGGARNLDGMLIVKVCEFDFLILTYS